MLALLRLPLCLALGLPLCLALRGRLLFALLHLALGSGLLLALRRSFAAGLGLRLPHVLRGDLLPTLRCLA